jgi:hypothetical protein
LLITNYFENTLKKINDENWADNRHLKNHDYESRKK